MKVFIYGTLKRWGTAAHRLEGQQFLRDVRTASLYRLVNCGDFPGLIRHSKGARIEGELWEIDEECRRRLDEYEGVPEGLYAFEQVAVEDMPEPVFAYFYLGDAASLEDAGVRW